MSEKRYQRREPGLRGVCTSEQFQNSPHPERVAADERVSVCHCALTCGV